MRLPFPINVRQQIKRLTNREYKPAPKQSYRDIVADVASSERILSFSSLKEFIFAYPRLIRMFLKFGGLPLLLIVGAEYIKDLFSGAGFDVSNLGRDVTIVCVAILLSPIALLIVSYAWMWARDLVERVFR